MEKKINYSQYSPSALAYLGDAVYNLYIREMQLKDGDMKTGWLHKSAISHVSAQAQAFIVDTLIDFMNDEEKYIYKRGRNANSPTIPKNAKPADYRKATGFEAVIGFLYLMEQKERLKEILEKSYSIINDRRN